jgi:hypothetical protein
MHAGYSFPHFRASIEASRRTGRTSALNLALSMADGLSIGGASPYIRSVSLSDYGDKRTME